MEDQLNEFNTLIAKLILVGVKVEDRDKLINVLCSFIDTWDHLVMTIKNSTFGTFNFDDAIATLLGEELR